MNKNIIAKILVLIIVLLSILFINNKVLGASAKISAPSTVYVGDKITVKVTGNAASWSGLTLSATGQISGSGGTMADVTNSGENENVTMGTYTFTATSVGSATFKLSGLVVNSDYTSSNAKDSKTVQIIKREEKKEETPQTTTTKKPTTTTIKPTKTTQTKQEEPKKEVVEDNFYINSIILKGIKENGQSEDIKLSPEFNKDTYEYTCNISSEITKIEIQKEAGQYTESIIVTGGENLQIGENTITLMLAAEDHQAKTYTIKVIKEETVETSANVTEEEKTQEKQEQKETAMVCMPVWAFIALQIGIIVVEVLTILFVVKRKKGQH